MKVLFENKDLIIVYKEAGVPVQKDNSGVSSLCDMVKEEVATDVFVITRLDRPVGGIVLFGKNKGAAAELSKLLQDKKITKTYYAVVCGKLTGEGELQDYIFKNQRENKSKIVNKGNIGAKLAKLNYKAVLTKDNLTLVKINLITGRHHQIRVQMSNFGYPLYGDTKYNSEFCHKRGVTTALFASELNFKYKNEEISVKMTPMGGVFDMFFNNFN
ncbi:MAG: RluA family pseudouridine synthase [Lachnospirales bacterium]